MAPLADADEALEAGAAELAGQPMRWVMLLAPKTQVPRPRHKRQVT